MIGQNNLSIKGIVTYGGNDLSIANCFPNLRMLACFHKDDFRSDMSIIRKLDQLYMKRGEFQTIANNGQNLTRLHLDEIC